MRIEFKYGNKTKVGSINIKTLLCLYAHCDPSPNEHEISDSHCRDNSRVGEFKEIRCGIFNNFTLSREYLLMLHKVNLPSC